MLAEGARPRVVVLIPTRDRAESLSRCVRSVARQTQLVDRVVVCDGSASCAGLDSSEWSSLPVLVVAASRVGACEQRNQLLDLVSNDTCDFVLYLDDDVEIATDYVQRLVACLQDESVDGAAGVSRGECASPLYMRAYRHLFMLGALREIGQMLPSGVNVAPTQVAEVSEVQWLFGCAMYRWSRVADLRFIERAAGYAAYDDVDYSLRVSRLGGRLIVDPGASLTHHHASGGRPDYAEIARSSLVNRYMVLLEYRPGIWSDIAFAWSCLGLLLLLTAQGFRTKNIPARESLVGIWAGIGELRRSRGGAL